MKAKRSTLTPRERAGILATYLAGVDVCDIADEFGVSRMTAWGVIYRAGVDRESAAWFARPSWDRMQSFVDGYNADLKGDVLGPEPVALNVRRR